MHPDRNVTCESFRKMVARQRERSRRRVRECRAQGVERLGVILSLSPCPPRRFARHAWVCAPSRWERRGQGRAAAQPPPGADPQHPHPHRQPPAQLPPSRLSLPSRPEAWQWAGGGKQEQEAHPTAEGGRVVILQPWCGVRQA